MGLTIRIMITTEDFLHPYGICSDTTLGESDKPLTELLEEYAEAYDRAKLKDHGGIGTVSDQRELLIKFIEWGGFDNGEPARDIAEDYFTNNQ